MGRKVFINLCSWVCVHGNTYPTPAAQAAVIGGGVPNNAGDGNAAKSIN